MQEEKLLYHFHKHLEVINTLPAGNSRHPKQTPPNKGGRAWRHPPPRKTEAVQHKYSKSSSLIRPCVCHKNLLLKRNYPPWRDGASSFSRCLPLPADHQAPLIKAALSFGPFVHQTPAHGRTLADYSYAHNSSSCLPLVLFFQSRAIVRCMCVNNIMCDIGGENSRKVIMVSIIAWRLNCF